MKYTKRKYILRDYRLFNASSLKKVDQRGREQEQICKSTKSKLRYAKTCNTQIEILITN